MNEQDAETYLELGITANDVVRLRWPDASHEKAAHILWEHTTYPLIAGLLDIVEVLAELPEEPCTGDEN